MPRVYSQSVFVGDVFPTKHSGNITVLKYTDSRTVLVEFNDGRTKIATASNILKKEVGNEYAPNAHGVGYIGLGEFKPYVSGHVASQEYSTWKGMLRRCYEDASWKRHPSYRGCSVSAEWHNFQNFAKWYRGQRGYDLGWQLDKDLTVLGNKIYSPEACALLPREVNNLLVSSKAKRGAYPVGVYWDKHQQTFITRIGRGNGVEVLGRYSEPSAAFGVYKVAKEEHVKAVAEKHKEILSTAIYNNLMNYTVSITD